MKRRASPDWASGRRSSSTPHWRSSSIVRTRTPRALGCRRGLVSRSIRTDPTPNRASRSAALRPTGPPPTTSTAWSGTDRSLLVDDRVLHHADGADLLADDVARLQEPRRVHQAAAPGRRAGEHDVPGAERHHVADELDQRRDVEDHVVGRGRAVLPQLVVDPELD